MQNVVPFDYQGQSVRFSNDGWINATDIAKRFGRRPVDWLKQKETQEYIAALADALKSDPESLYETRKGKGVAGTWLHPKLGVRFAQWLDVRFAVWCDLHIDALMRGDLNAQQQFDAASKALDNQIERGSLAGRELAKHRWNKPPLVARMEYWRDQLQMALPLS